jgi:hypothetical protein
MDTTKAEYLPNELWLQVFSYLENLDLLYAFNMLNKRFQQIITPYFNDIDLSEVSLKQFNTFMKDILLSEQEYNICSLSLRNSGQFKQIFYPQGREHHVVSTLCIQN